MVSFSEKSRGEHLEDDGAVADEAARREPSGAFGLWGIPHSGPHGCAILSISRAHRVAAITKEHISKNDSFAMPDELTEDQIAAVAGGCDCGCEHPSSGGPPRWPRRQDKLISPPADVPITAFACGAVIGRVHSQLLKLTREVGGRGTRIPLPGQPEITPLRSPAPSSEPLRQAVLTLGLPRDRPPSARRQLHRARLLTATGLQDIDGEPDTSKSPEKRPAVTSITTACRRRGHQRMAAHPSGAHLEESAMPYVKGPSLADVIVPAELDRQRAIHDAEMRLNSLGQQLVTNSQSDKTKYLNCLCVDATWDRLKIAAAQVGVAVPSDKASNFGRLWYSYNKGTYLSLPWEYRGAGAAGAMAYQGLGSLINQTDIWAGNLQPGAIMQAWRFAEDYYRARDGEPILGDPNIHYGHSFIFLNYVHSDKAITGMEVADNGFARGKPFAPGAFALWFGANHNSGVHLIDLI